MIFGHRMASLFLQARSIRKPKLILSRASCTCASSRSYSMRFSSTYMIRHTTALIWRWRCVWNVKVMRYVYGGRSCQYFCTSIPKHCRHSALLAISLLSSTYYSSLCALYMLMAPSCLYHTFKILLYRPMLNRKACGNFRRPDPAHLLECLTAATSTIVIFNLFIRSFGDSHIILSLSYSVYTAASIFLLQIQANIRDEQAHKRLDFCMRSLDRVKSTNPIIASALNNLVQELIKMDVQIAPQFRPKPLDLMPPYQPSSSFDRTLPVPVAFMSTTPQATPTPPGTIPPLDGVNFEDFKVTPEMFEAFSLLEPITATVGGIEENQKMPGQ